MNQSFNTGAIGYSNQELFSQRGAGLVKGDFPWPQDVGEPMAFDTYNQTTSRVTQTLCSRGDTPGGNAHLVPAVLAKVEVVDTDEPAYCYPDADELGYAPFDEVVDTTPLAASAHVPSVALASVLAPTLTASNDPSRSPQSAEITQQVTAVFAARMVVRRLTPRECERLQGFPDDYTSISWKGKPAVDCPDGPRYKALGNSMAVPCMAWIGRRIVRHLSESAG